MTRLEKECIVNALLYYSMRQAELEEHQRKVRNLDAAAHCARNKNMAAGLANVFINLLENSDGDAKT